MCILFIYVNPEPEENGYKLIIASNRDEFYRRPAKKAFLCDRHEIIGGRDMTEGREGGMWLGMGSRGPKIRVGALLNVTGEDKVSDPVVMGRGPIVYDFLKSKLSVAKYLNGLRAPKLFNAFNVVLIEIGGDESMVYHHSNTPEITYCYPGEQILAFGNSTPQSPLTKVDTGREWFKKIVKNNLDREELINQLLDLLKSKDKHLPDPELERRAPYTFEELSSIFVEIQEDYGTRTHSIILVNDINEIQFIEYTLQEPINIKDPVWEKTVVTANL